MSEILVSSSPSNREDVVGRFSVADATAVSHAVERARAALPGWRDLGFDGRSALLRRFRDLAAAPDRVEELARLIARETGKALWDSRGEAKLLAAKVDVTLNEGMRFVADLDAGAGACATFHPRGVIAVFGPFNFPAHLPNGHIVPALATGNTVVFKPSDQTPAVGAWMVDLWRQVGLPDGVIELAQGGEDTGRALAIHEDVNAILFTGSYAVGRALREATLDQPDKLLALEMGGNNGIIVLADADLDVAVAETALSICASTGQRCTCAGRIFVERAIADEFSDALIHVLERVRIGDPMDDGVFMGPLIHERAADHLAEFRQLAADAGGLRVMLVEPDLPAPFVGPGLVRFFSSAQPHPYQREEIFGPEARLYPVDDLDEAIAAVNDSDYGLAASVMTKSRSHYERCVGRVRTGLLNWNKSTVGASGKLPFGGGGKSGNPREAGVLSTLYCAVPQSHLESDASFDPASLPPGMPKP